MLADILACLALYFFFKTIYDNSETASVASQDDPEESDSLDDWEPESEGGITLPCATPSPPPTLPPWTHTPETIVQVTLIPESYNQLSEAYQALIDSDERNWWSSPYGTFRHPFPKVPKRNF